MKKKSTPQIPNPGQGSGSHFEGTYRTFDRLMRPISEERKKQLEKD